LNWSADGLRLIGFGGSVLYAMHNGAGDSVTQLVVGHDISALSISTDGIVAAALEMTDGTTVVDTRTMRVMRRIESEDFAAQITRLSPDGMLLLMAGSSGSGRNMLAAYEMQSGRRIKSRQTIGSLCALAVSPDKSLIATSTCDGLIEVVDASTFQSLFHVSTHVRLPALSFSSDGSTLIVAAGFDGDNYEGGVAAIPLKAFGTPESQFEGRTTSLAVARTIATSTIDLAADLALTTPDGTRRIVGGADKTIRLYEAKDGKPTLPATAEQPEGVYREVAVFRMPEAVTNLQMTADGTRLIIQLEGGSARVWDIRDPEERRKDLQAEWAERVPAGAYLDTQWDNDALWATDPPDAALRDHIVNDQSLTPLRRLVAAEMLEERLEDDRAAAEQAFESLSKDQTDKAAVQAAAAAADLPRRVKGRVVAMAGGWEYKPPKLREAERLEEELTEETKRRRLLEADRVAGLWGTDGQYGAPQLPSLDEFRMALAIREEVLGQTHARTLDVLRMVAFLESKHGHGVDRFADLVARTASTTDQPTGHLISLYCEYASEAALSGDFERAEAALAFVRENVGLLTEEDSLSVGETFFAHGGVNGRVREVRSEILKCINGLSGANLRRDAWFWMFRSSNLVQSVSAIRRADQLFVDASRSFESIRFNASETNPHQLVGLVLLRVRRNDFPAALSAAVALSALSGWEGFALSTSAIARDYLASADPLTLAAAGEVDMKADPTLNDPLTPDQHRQRAREALAKARALMQPAADGTPSPWANDEAAKALLAEAEALITP
jgi:hypothetical protein